MLAEPIVFGFGCSKRLPLVSVHDEIPEQLLDLIYESAAEPTLWLSVVQEVARALNSDSGMLLVQRLDNRLVIDRISGLSEASADAYRARHVRNPFTLYLVDKPIGTVVSSAEMLPLPQLQRTAFFDEVLRTQSLDHSAFNILVAQDGIKGGICLNRETKRGAYEGRELRMLELLTPHLRRSLRLAMQFDAYKLIQQAQFDALEHLAVGVLMLDGRGRVILANAAARQWSRAGGPLILTAGAFTHRATPDARRLDKLLRGAISGTPMASVGVSGADQEEALLIVACAVRRNESERLVGGGLRQPSALVFVFDTANREGVPAEWLIEGFGLTPMEARVALASAGGAGTIDAAAMLGISPNTVKTHLGRIFGKTGTSGQVQLAGLVASVGTLRR